MTAEQTRLVTQIRDFAQDTLDGKGDILAALVNTLDMGLDGRHHAEYDQQADREAAIVWFIVDHQNL